MARKVKVPSDAPAPDITERKQAEEELRSSEERLRILFEYAPDAYYLSDLKGNFVDGNKAAEEITGYRREELIGKSFLKLKLLSPRQIPKAAALLVKNVLGQATGPDEFILNRKDGTQIPVEIRTFPVKIEGKTLVLGIARDITERKRLEQDLNERVKELQCLYGIARIDERLGIISDELYQEIANLLLASWQYPGITCARITINGKKFETENYKETKWKQSSDIKVYGAKAGQVEVSYLEERPEIDEGPFSKEERLLIDAVAKQLGNITERKRAEAKLRESDERYRAIFESTSDMLVLIDRKGKILDVNENIAQISEYEREEIVGKNIRALTKMMTKKSLAIIAKNFLKRMAGMNIPPYEIQMIKKNGELRSVEINAVALRKDGRIVGDLAIMKDITERKKREQLQHDENYVLTLLGQGAELSQLLDAIVRLGEYHDPSIKGSVLLFDPSREYLVQASAPSLPDDYNELLKNGLPIGPNVGSCGTAAYLKERVIVSDIENSPLFKPFEEAVKRAISNGLLSCWSQPIISSNGDLLGTIANYSNKLGEPNADSLRVLEWSARIAAISIERKQAEQELQKKNEQLDAQNEELRATEEELRASNEELQATNEELRDAQEKLVRSERLAAIGQLAGGVGHELRNPLSAIKNAVYYVRGKVAKSELGQKEPQVIEFLDIMDDEINSSSKIINDLLGFSRVGKPTVSPTRIERVIDDALSYTTIPENIELTKKLDTDLPEVKIDTDQVRQVLVNMILNAVQAMPTGGKLTINAKEKDKFLEVEITDTGCGMPHEVMVKIFDPLFTTRAKGIGLGLAVCKAIIDRHTGYIEVKSEVEKGTTFIIKLPLRAE